ncbi:MAG: hypothetical protein H6728_00855 [Myxococcales bacterium]|nr:hypothetical protein [Myxococcales bacterium]
MRWEQLSSACLSEYRMDRRLLQLEDASERAASEKHLQQCSRCREEFAWLEQERAAFQQQAQELPQALEHTLQAQCRSEEDQEVTAKRPKEQPMWGLLWSWRVLAACSLFLFASLSWKQLFPTRYTTYRSADEPVFLVGLKRGSEIRQMHSGEFVQPGDHIRLAYHWRTKKAAFLYVVHRDQASKISSLYPSSSEEKSLRIETFREVALPGSLEFDQAAQGHEEIWACFSRRPLFLKDLTKILPKTSERIHWEPRPYGPCSMLFLYQFRRSRP